MARTPRCTGTTLVQCSWRWMVVLLPVAEGPDTPPLQSDTFTLKTGWIVAGTFDSDIVQLEKWWQTTSQNNSKVLNFISSVI